MVEEQLELALQHVQPFATRLLDHVDQFFIRHQKKLERLTAIAVTMPGIIDTEHGIIHRMPFYEDVKDMPLGEILANHTGVSVYIQHDISAWTMAESLFGASRGARDVIQVVIDHNVGAGVITDGRLLHAGCAGFAPRALRHGCQRGHTDHRQLGPQRQPLGDTNTDTHAGEAPRPAAKGQRVKVG